MKAFDILYDLAWDFGYNLRCHQSNKADSFFSTYYSARLHAASAHLKKFLPRATHKERLAIGARIRRAIEVAEVGNPLPKRQSAIRNPQS